MRDGRREAKNLARTVARPAQPTPATAVTGYASARAWEGACQPSWRMAMGIGTRESGRIKVGTFEHNCGTSRRRQRRLVSFVAASPNDQPKQLRSAKDRQRWPSLQTVHTSSEEKSALYPPPCAPVHQARPPQPRRRLSERLPRRLACSVISALIGPPTKQGYLWEAPSTQFSHPHTPLSRPPRSSRAFPPTVSRPAHPRRDRTSSRRMAGGGGPRIGGGRQGCLGNQRLCRA